MHPHSKVKRLSLISQALIVLASLHGLTATAANSDDDAYWQLPAYLEELRQSPLRYRMVDEEVLDGVVRRTYVMTSQYWPISSSVTGQEWVHSVEVYIPQLEKSRGTLGRSATLVINNGINRGIEGDPSQEPSDFSKELLARIARGSGMIAVSLSDVPNQYLALDGEELRSEDRLVAATWRSYMDLPTSENSSLPLHVPMAGAAVRAMDLVQREFSQLGISRFVVTGASKRAWAGWLTTLGDERVSALVPFVIDMNITALIEGVSKRYGGGWPVALAPYVDEGITQRYQTPEFSRLMQISDPYKYLGTPLEKRLDVPKFVVNASGDDFFPPDTAQTFLGALPGATGLYVAPNSDHYGIRSHIEATLLSFLKRQSMGVAMPSISAESSASGHRYWFSARSSELPVNARLWVARNEKDRDFRYACGIRYESVSFEREGGTFESSIADHGRGWVAAFFQFEYADGFIASTPVQVFPQDKFPSSPPADGEGACLMAR